MTAQGSLFAQATKARGPTGGTWSVTSTHRPGVVCELTYLEGTLLRTLYIVTDAPQVGDGPADAHLLKAAPRLRDALQALVDQLPDFPDPETPDGCAIRLDRVLLTVRDIRRAWAALAATIPLKPELVPTGWTSDCE